MSPLFRTEARPTTTHGTKLLQEFDEFLAAHEAAAADRDDVVEARLRALEAEQADLHALQAKITAARG